MTPAEVRAATFKEEFRGYSPGAVDALLERLATLVETNQPLWPVLTGAAGLPRALRGYSVDGVDRFLAQLGGPFEGGAAVPTDQVGQHFGLLGKRFAPDEIPHTWLTTDDRHVLRVRVTARGVVRSLDWDPRAWLLWPVTWPIHWLLYRGQWKVEVIERRVTGWILWSGGRERYSYTCSSRREAVEARREISNRIEQIATGREP